MRKGSVPKLKRERAAQARARLNHIERGAYFRAQREREALKRNFEKV